MNPFRSIHDYEEYIYTLKSRYPVVQSSNIIIFRRGKRTAILQGEVTFKNGFRIVIKERLSFDPGHVLIENYGYELWRLNDKFTWYDSQPHPDDSMLATTNPHHKHIHPNIKHNRIPASNMHFDQPNIPFLIQEIEELMGK